jgi:ORF6N domain
MNKINPKQIPNTLPISSGFIERRIYTIRGQQVMIDSDLAELYQVLAKRLNEAVKRNQSRFPKDFMFQLTAEELQNLRSQIMTSKKDSPMRSQFATGSKRNTRFLPYAFTEYGVVMLSSVLNSHRAIQMNITIVRAFIQLREMLEQYKNFSKQIAKIKGTQDLHTQVLLKVVKNLKIISTPKNTNAIGFRIK